ncbi:hypothetical protein Y032_0031g2303 [Ancylostoma ceylanicum]|uniref:Uncharacterized protein n=1 Tax=Ancylostoma ceylanicum TaxID=53326 RepID=A0A016UQF3_9BILA|nr:hypothetical protein Y032_0031g2303 [Ancylostoma ceylanicum]
MTGSMMLVHTFRMVFYRMKCTDRTDNPAEQLYGAAANERKPFEWLDLIQLTVLMGLVLCALEPKLFHFGGVGSLVMNNQCSSKRVLLRAFTVLHCKYGVTLFSVLFYVPVTEL